SREAAETLPSERAFAPPVAPPEPPAPVESHPAWPVSELPAPDDRTAEASAPESETAADLVDSPVEASFADLGEAASGEPPAAPAHSEAASVSVPVEMVAQIAQRVVSQISEKVVREVAWEVIPDLAEAIIRKEIERLKAELQQS
ncbi:MAG TPA: hypothetical protein VIC87_06865, partial [Vicinamibacteria bacterium]